MGFVGFSFFYYADILLSFRRLVFGSIIAKIEKKGFRRILIKKI